MHGVAVPAGSRGGEHSGGGKDEDPEALGISSTAPMVATLQLAVNDYS